MKLRERLYYLRYQVTKLRKEKQELQAQILKLKQIILKQQELIEEQMFRILNLKREKNSGKRMPDIIKGRRHMSSASGFS